MNSFDEEPIERRRLYQEVMDRLIRLIREEGLTPGDHLPSERDEGRDFSAERGDFLDVFLGAFLVRPEIRLGHLAFQVG